MRRTFALAALWLAAAAPAAAFHLKQSAAFSRPVLMVDSTDHVSGKTGLTLTITASKDGAAFAGISPTVTELATGWYKVALTSSHTDTLGALCLHVTGTGADATDVCDQVIAFDLGTASVAQTGDSYARLGAPAGASHAADVLAVDNFVDDLESRLGTPSNLGGGATVAFNLSDIEAQTDDIGAAGAGLTAVTCATVGDKTGYRLSATGVDDVWDEATSGHSTAGTTGKALTDAASAGDPLATACPGGYAAGTVGEVLCDLDGVSVEVLSPASISGTTVRITKGDSLAAGGAGALSFTGLASVASTDTWTLRLERGGTEEVAYTCTYVSSSSVSCSITAAQTAALSAVTYTYRLRQVTQAGLVYTQVRDGQFIVRP